MTATPRRSIEGRPPARYLRTARDRSQQRQEMRAAVVAAALRLFLDRGHLAVRLEDIVDEVGISRATFYKYFSERDEILAELFEQLLTTEVDPRRAAPASSAS